MSTAWYRSGHVPTLVKRWVTRSLSCRGSRSSLQVEVWDSTCVVHNMQPQPQQSHRPTVEYCHHNILLNPANPQLSGVSKFPYFPIGGPQPPEDFAIQKDTHPIMGYVSQWGGMEVGNGMMFASNVVDGMVHQLGGKDLQRQLQQVLQENGVSQLKEGEAVLTSTANIGTIQETTGYQYIIHAVPPFYNDEHNTAISRDGTSTKEVLAETYRNAIRIAASEWAPQINDDTYRIRVATPLLGAGCRGFPVDAAIDVAATTLFGSLSSMETTTPVTLAFAIPTGDTRQRLVDAFDDARKNL